MANRARLVRFPCKRLFDEDVKVQSWIKEIESSVLSSALPGAMPPPLVIVGMMALLRGSDGCPSLSYSW